MHEAAEKELRKSHQYDKFPILRIPLSILLFSMDVPTLSVADRKRHNYWVR